MAGPALPVTLVINRSAGLGRAGRVEARLRQCLEAMNADVRVAPTHSCDHAAEVCSCLREECDRILLAGGDGTVNSVLPSLAGSRAVMGLLPLGMANVLARELRIPLTLPGMCRVATGDHVRSIDLGCANGRPFALMAGVGFDAQVVAAVNPRLKRWIGPAAYVLTATALARKAVSARVEVTHDGNSFQAPAWLAVVANTSRYTYHWRAVPGASPADGLLDLCMFRCCSARGTAGQVMAALRGSHLDHPDVLSVRAADFTLTAAPPLPVQLDGDAAGCTPVHIAALPGSLKVLVP